MSADEMVGTRLQLLLDITRHALTVEGEIWECGVLRGRSARWIAFQASELLLDGQMKTVRLFDTFVGRSSKGKYDTGPNNAMFAGTSLTLVQQVVPWGFVQFHKGLIPKTFIGLEDSKIAFLHLDVDLYQPTYESLKFVLPRLTEFGVVVLDDYEHSEWPGVTTAVQHAMAEINGFYVTKIEHQGIIRHKGSV
jgi:hypothetical protein